MIQKTQLYVLSLVIAETEDMVGNIQVFLKSMVEEGIADQARIWLNLPSLLPSSMANKGSLLELYDAWPVMSEKPKTHTTPGILDLLSDEGFLADPSETILPWVEPLPKAKRFLLSLGGAGLIEIISQRSTKSFLGFQPDFSKTDYQALVPVLDKFTIQLRRDARRLDKKMLREGNATNKSAIGNLLVKKDFQRRIVATLSHELRNPLNIILGYLNLLSETKLSKDQQEKLEIINDTSQGLYNTVKKVFQFTNLLLDQHVTDTASFNIVQVFDYLEKRTAHLANKKRLQLSFEIGDGLAVWLLGDVAKLNDILTYLIDNAIKFTSEGNIVVKVKLLTNTVDSLAAQFEVSDTGKGIDSNHQDQIFEFFGQEDDSITRHYGGLGLGLSIAREFVDQMGGSMQVKSQKQKGTLVLFSLPFRRDIHRSDPVKGFQLEVDQKLSAKIKILLVDDDAYQRDMGSKVLKGWNLHLAENGLDAINFLRNNPDTEVILMDIRMPVMDGISATRMIRNELNSKALIVAVSGEVQETTIEECLEAGMDCFVPKPYDKNLLLQTIVDKLKRPELVHAEAESVDNTKLTGRLALIVEDNKMIQLLTARHMKDAGCIYDLASDGQSAVELFAAKKYDFVLLDLYLPDIDGLELSKIFRKHHENSCIIAYSGDDSDETREACQKAGIDGLILKNYLKTEELALQINQHLQLRQKQNESVSPNFNPDYDLLALMKIVGNNQDDLKDILNSFISYSSQVLESLRQAAESTDRQSIRKLSHAMKSSARQFQMIRIAEVLERLEYEIDKMDKAEVEKHINQVIEVFSRNMKHMKEKYF